MPAKLIDEDETAKLSENVESAEDSLIEEYQKCDESDSESDPVKQLFKETDPNRSEMDTEPGETCLIAVGVDRAIKFTCLGN